MKKAATVILNYNGREVLPIFLPSVIAHSSYDVWMIDNASTDDSVGFLETEFPQVSLLRLSSNFGFAGGYNWGLEELRGKYEYLILLNSDVEVSRAWDRDLIAWLETHPDFAAVQPKILSWQNRDTFDYAGAGGGFLDTLGYPYCRGRIWDTLEKDHGQYDDAVQVDWASGACLAIRAADFFAHEGFDAHFFAHMEEIDLCWRMRRAGRKIGYVGSVKVYHQGGATLDRSSPRKLYLNIRNSLSMIRKNVGGTAYFGIVFAKALFECAAALGYFLRGQQEFGAAIIQGYRDFWRGRKLFSTPKEKPEMEISTSGPVRFVFWSYLVRRKRVFTDL